MSPDVNRMDAPSLASVDYQGVGAQVGPVVTVTVTVIVAVGPPKDVVGPAVPVCAVCTVCAVFRVFGGSVVVMVVHPQKEGSIDMHAQSGAQVVVPI